MEYIIFEECRDCGIKFNQCEGDYCEDCNLNFCEKCMEKQEEAGYLLTCWDVCDKCHLKKNKFDSEKIS